MGRLVGGRAGRNTVAPAAVILQAEGPSTSIVNGAVVVLVIIFLTLPVIFLLAEYARNRSGRAPAREGAEEETAGPRRPRRRRNVAPDRAVHLLRSHELEHMFWRERPPREVGFVPGDSTVRGPVKFRGNLQLGPRVVIEGNVDVSGSLAMENGAEVQGDVVAAGNIYADAGARIEGVAKAGANVYCAQWGSLRDVACRGTLEVEAGAEIRGRVEADRVVQVASIREDNPQPRPRNEASIEHEGEAERHRGASYEQAPMTGGSGR